jgi:Na+/H+-dicarboxylate symporter
MSFSKKILLGLTLGVLTGLLLGERAGFLQVVADAYVKLLQMTVLPYVMVSLISGLGSLSYEQAKALGLRAGLVLLGLWAIALATVFLFPLVFPHIQTASFFSTTLIEPRQPFDFISLYIPANPFHSLANNVVPAVVLFSIVLGVALIGTPEKQRVLDVLATFNAAVSRATGFIVALTPYGLFAIAAATVGTLSLEQAERLQVYLVSYVAISLLLSLWVLPGLVAALTPIPYLKLLSVSRDALITAFMTSNLFIVLPILTEQSKALLREYGVGQDKGETLPEVIVPASFNFPHVGKLLTLSFILFAGWFADAAIGWREYPRLAFTGLVVLFGSINVAVPFLLDLFRVPADTFQLFLATSAVNARFGTLMAAVHTLVIALLGTCAIVGALRFDAGKILRYVLVTGIVTLLVLGGVRALIARTIDLSYQKADVIANMEPLEERGEAIVHRSMPAPVSTEVDRPVLDAMRERGTLRVGFLPDSLPFVYFNARHELVGFDVEMAHKLARDLGVGLELVPVERGQLVSSLNGGVCDVVMSGVAVTTDRAREFLLSATYLDETMAFVVIDDRRDEFGSWEAIRARRDLTLGVPNLPYYVSKVKARVPQARLRLLDSATDIFGEKGRGLDATVLTAERGSVWTLLHPEYSVAVPGPELLKIPLAYPIARHDQDLASVVNAWIELKRKDGTIQALYDYWILGRNATPRKPHWSILRNVLHWVD